MKHYDHHHTTVAEARACEAQRGTTKTAEKPLYATRLERAHTKATPVAKAAAKPAPAFVAKPAHPNRVKFANDLINKRDTNLISFAANEVMMNVLGGKPVSADEIGLLIDDLLAAPRKDVKSASNPNNAPQAQAQAANGPTLRDLCATLADEGYYALRAEGVVHFYRVSRSKKGYVKVQEQASDTLHPVDYRRSLAVAKAITENTEAAQQLYAQELGQCYACARTLTDETSRELGIGPVCRSK